MKIFGIPLGNISGDIAFLLKYIRYSEDNIILKYKNNELKFVKGTLKQTIRTLALLRANFIEQEYWQCDVKEKCAVDIGANIGDTALLFALQGARHIYAFEPYPYSFKMALQNIQLSGMNDQITMINAGCGAKKDRLIIDPKYVNDTGSKLRNFKHGKMIEILPLSYIVKKYGINRGALKLDCEGCEYGVLLGSSNSTLRHFNEIILEYHHGYKELKGRLEGAGFKVKVEKSKNSPGLGIMHAKITAK